MLARRAGGKRLRDTWRTGSMRAGGTAVNDRPHRRLNLHLDRWQRKLPAWIAPALGWLRRPAARWLRIPLGVLLVLSGVLGVLPVLGFWMAIPGLLLLALDVPFLRLPVRVAIVRVNRAVARWRRRRRQRG